MDTYAEWVWGFYIAAQIVHRHGGQISVASKLGRVPFSRSLCLNSNPMKKILLVEDDVPHSR
jgi:hypothetical protein